MRLQLFTLFLTTTLLVSRLHAGRFPIENIDSLAQKAEIIVVAQVVKVEDAGTIVKMGGGRPEHRLHATLKVLRGIQVANSKPLELKQLVLDYPGYLGRDPEIVLDLGFMNFFTLGELGLFPLKRRQGSTIPHDPPEKELWGLVSENSKCATLPAVEKRLNDKPPQSAKDFFYRELAGSFVHGDANDICQAVTYIHEMSWAANESVTPALKLLEQQILSEERWLDIFIAGYGSLRPQQSAAENSSTPTKQVYADNTLLRLAVSKLDPEKFEQNLIHRVIVLQEAKEGDAVSNLAELKDQYLTNPLFMQLEKNALEKGLPGAMGAICFGIRVNTDPYFPAAVQGSKVVLTSNDKKYDPSLVAAVNLIIKLGSEKDMAYLLEQVSKARKDNPEKYQQILQAAFACERNKPKDQRTTQIFGAYIDDTSPLIPELFSSENDWMGTVPGYKPTTDLRVCDQAGLLIQWSSAKDFGLTRSQPLPLRDEKLQAIRAWLNPK